jgi:hypothetical protein
MSGFDGAAACSLGIRRRGWWSHHMAVSPPSSRMIWWRLDGNCGWSHQTVVMLRWVDHGQHHLWHTGCRLKRWLHLPSRWSPTVNAFTLLSRVNTLRLYGILTNLISQPSSLRMCSVHNMCILQCSSQLFAHFWCTTTCSCLVLVLLANTHGAANSIIIYFSYNEVDSYWSMYPAC